MTSTPHTDFWDLAETYLAEDDIEEGTLMNNPCLRASGDFLATIHRTTSHLVVKLNTERVSELIAEGTGIAFAPARKTFTEWIAIPDHDPDVWKTIIDEAIDINRTQR